ncbi:LysR family transcriptional regulator [Pseudodesulfovibrio piezophilus]|uniref:Transcriptional regulator, LysR family n=1 Tax=Pseudodesulfovibrio piezophilus (strain DSM 21447 / JCM 15486 / C1TLV30) TaxID=1322246 RepID=M1WKD8_PSEP2|nr:LysR family transcriptional regulator [Pseudodesulfovibrio piezophilus]CCH49426.1 Transcriptional regulator, LysR family [Pseudodesulfovibrio piezophilus C1TLV30]
MELYQLRTLVAVAEEGNFTRAGKRVHATQPAISAHIKALEEELGVRLFDRTPRGVELTVAGSELIVDAIEVLAAAEKLQAKAVTLHGEIAGKISIGLCTDPTYLNVTALLEYMSERFPKLNLKLVQSPSGVILTELRAKNIDAAFVFSGNPYGDIQAIKLAEPEYFIVGAAQWQDRLASANATSLSEFTWVMPTSHCPFRELQLKIFKDHAITPAQTIGADSEEVIRPLVVQGKALALVRDDEVASLLESGHCAVCTSLGRHPVELNFVYRKAQEEDPAIAALINVVRELWSL